MATSRPALVLASASPRRAKLLREAGFEFSVIAPPIDDGPMRPGNASPLAWAASLAYLKAAAVRRQWPETDYPPPVMLGADTIVVCHGRLLGQPADRADAERILRALSGAEHDVITGVAVLSPDGSRHVFSDEARVRVGPLSDAMIATYLDSNEWSGKAGAYNLVERLAAGWPITYEGDPGTIMGLPMNLLTPVLRRALGAAAGPRPVTAAGGAREAIA